MKKITETQYLTPSERRGKRSTVPVLMEENSFVYTEPDFRPACTDVWINTPMSLLYQLKTSVTENMQDSVRAILENSGKTDVGAASFGVCYRYLLK